jgi:tetratricopeptide (TPR) repeat protein
MVSQNVSNERKKELRQLDPLQRNLLNALAFAGTYKKQLLWVLGAVVVVAVVFAGIMTSFKRAENKASDLVAGAMERYRSLAHDPNAAYQAVADDFQTVLNNYANTSAGRIAQLRFAGICMDAGQYDQAGKWFEKALENMGDQAGMRNFVLSSLGHVWLAKNDLERAKAYFIQIETGKSDLLKDEARFLLAKIYEDLNNDAESLKMYDMLANDAQGSIYSDLARSRVETAAVQ